MAWRMYRLGLSTCWRWRLTSDGGRSMLSMIRLRCTPRSGNRILRMSWPTNWRSGRSGQRMDRGPRRGICRLQGFWAGRGMISLCGMRLSCDYGQCIRCPVRTMRPGCRLLRSNWMERTTTWMKVAQVRVSR